VMTDTKKNKKIHIIVKSIHSSLRSESKMKFQICVKLGNFRKRNLKIHFTECQGIANIFTMYIYLQYSI